MYRFVFKNYKKGDEHPFYVDTEENASRFAELYAIYPNAVFTQLYAKRGTSQFRLKDYNSGKSVDVFMLDPKMVKPFINYMRDHGDEVRLEYRGEFNFDELPCRHNEPMLDSHIKYEFGKERKNLAKTPHRTTNKKRSTSKRKVK
jgi:hypothetical protein